MNISRIAFRTLPKISTTDHSLISGNTINMWKKTDVMYITNNDHNFIQEPPTYLCSKLVIYITRSLTYPGYIDRFRAVSYTHLTLPTTSRV